MSINMENFKRLKVIGILSLVIGVFFPILMLIMNIRAILFGDPIKIFFFNMNEGWIDLICILLLIGFLVYSYIIYFKIIEKIEYLTKLKRLIRDG